MDSVELCWQLLGLATPWTVEQVELDVTQQRVDVYATHPAGARFACPECGGELGVYDHTPERVWRHLDSCQFLTHLHARTPRVACPEHGVKQVRLPWAEASSRFTHLFMAALKYRATRTRHADVLQRAAGYLKKHLTAAENIELVGLIGVYRRGATSLAVPIARLRHYTLRHTDPRLSGQTYFHPDPREFGLRYRI